LYDILFVAPKHLLQIPDDSHVWLGGTGSESTVHCFVLDSFSDGNIALVADHSQISHKFGFWILLLLMLLLPILFFSLTGLFFWI